MDALLVVDMQQGLQRGEPKHELDEVVARINRLSVRVRKRGGRVISSSTVVRRGTTSSRRRRAGRCCARFNVSPATRSCTRR